MSDSKKDCVVGSCGRIFKAFQVCDLPKLDDLCWSGCCMNGEDEDRDDVDDMELEEEE